MLIKFIFFILSTVLVSNNAFAICTALDEKIYYLVKKDDHIAKVLRGFNLIPIFCENCSLKSMLKINNYENENLIQPEDQIALPFKCKEDYVNYQTTLVENRKFIQFEKNSYNAVLNTEKKIEPVDTINRLKKVLPSDYNKIVVSSRSTGYLIENGENDFSKIDCNGQWNNLNSQCEDTTNEIYFELSNTFLKIDYALPNNSGAVSSFVNPTAFFDWTHSFKNNFKSYFGSRLSYHNISQTDLNLLSKNTDTYAFNFDMSYQIQSWDLLVGVSKESKYYLFSVNTNDNILLKSYPDFFQLQITRKWNFNESFYFQSFINLKNSFNSTSNASFRPERIINYSLGTIVRANFPDSELFNSFIYKVSIFKEDSNSNVSDQKSTGLQIGIGKNWILN